MTSAVEPGAGAEFDVEVAWADLTLVGTIHLPGGDRPPPVMLMIQGSGPADRECDGYFAEIRSAFLTRGIATCAVDKPGCGDSTGDWREHDLAARADQAAAVIASLRRHGEIDGRRIGVWGQSQGGWVVQQLAAAGNGLACAAINSGPSIGVTDQDEFATEHLLRRDGFGDAEVDEALAYTRALHRAARSGAAFETVLNDIVAPVVDRRWYALGPTADDAAEWELMTRFVEEAYDPIDALRRIDIPVLAVFGGLDVLVPAWRGAAETGTALAAAGTRDATVTVFPGGDHRIRVTDGGFAAGYLDLLGDWTAHRLG